MKRWQDLVKRVLMQEGLFDASLSYTCGGHLCIQASGLKGPIFIASTPREKTRTLRSVRRDIRKMKVLRGCNA